MKAYCIWGAESPETIINQLGDMNNLFYTESEQLNVEIEFTTMQANIKAINYYENKLKDDYLESFMEFPTRFMLGSHLCCRQIGCL